MRISVFLISVCFILVASVSCKNAANNSEKNNSVLQTSAESDTDTQTGRGCYLTVNNQAETAVRLKNGIREYRTSSGIKGIQMGTQETFLISFYKLPDGTYPATLKIASLSIGTGLYPYVSVPEYEFKLDSKYEIMVTGKEADNLSLGPIIEK